MTRYSHYTDAPAVAMQLSRNVLVAFIQVDLDDNVLERFRAELLQRVHDSACRGVILDLSGLDTIDSTEFAALRGVMSMVEIMGTEPILVGMRPGVVSSLIETGAPVEGLRAAADLDAAFSIFYPEQTANTDQKQGPEIDDLGVLPTDAATRDDTSITDTRDATGTYRE